MGDLTKNFSLYEFYSKDGGTLPEDIKQNITLLSYQLQELRDYLRSPVIVNSGYRTREYNDWLIDNGYPAVKNSKHLLGIAADIRVDGKSSLDLKGAIEYLIYRGRMQQGGIGIYNTFVHYDMRKDNLGKPIRARWDMRS